MTASASSRADRPASPGPASDLAAIRRSSAAAVRRSWLLGEELALVDLRGEARHAIAHPLFAASLPFGRIEGEVRDRVPRLTTPIVLFDDDATLIAPAARILDRLGYSDVAWLEGGLNAWRDAGFELFADVNSPSKAFGELVAERRGTPLLPATEVRALIDAGADIAILDARTFEEYRTMNIPGSASVPGADLVLAAAAAEAEPGKLLIVNCAGRTRSIIGTQSLVNAGVSNPVAGLRNGTIGWTLEGFALEHGQTRAEPIDPAADHGIAIARAREVSYAAGVRHITLGDYLHLARNAGRTLYRFDLRPPEEFAAGHLPGFRPVAGGQLVQETDYFAPVRGARIVLVDGIGPRADMTASWLAQMNWEVDVLDYAPGEGGEAGAWQPHRPAAARVAELDPQAAAVIDPAVLIVDVGTSPAYRRGHVPGALFCKRESLPALLKTRPGVRLLLCSPDGTAARYAAADIAESGRVCVLAGGTHAWHAAGHAVETGMTASFGPVDDVYRRPYEGTDNPASAMQAYLDWEYGLVAQLARDGSHGFYVI